MIDRDLHPVTTKAALYALDNSAVLVMKYLASGPLFAYGLPGGHIDRDERPDQAIRRELKEELGLSPIDLERKDFFVHASGKIVLGFVGKIERTIELNPPKPHQEVGVWLGRDEFEPINIDKGYKNFVLTFWPKPSL